MLRSTIRRMGPSKGAAHYAGVLPNGIARAYNLLMTRGEGTYMYTEDGKRYLDLTSGIGVTNLGHCHPRLVKVVQTQAATLWHGQLGMGTHKALADLIDDLSTVMPKHLTNLFFCSTGAEAVEGALRLARNATGRQNVIAVQGAYHGRTNACMAITTSKYSYHIGCKPLMPGVTIVPCPFTSQLKVSPNSNMDEEVKRCLGIFDDLIFQTTNPKEVAMVIVEPVLGEGGYVPLPKAYLEGLTKRCKDHGILFVLDEVQTGYGRTGSMFMAEQIGIEPDMMLFAKGVANGLPLAGVAMRPDIAKASIPGTQGGTYSGNALSCASASEVIKVFRDERILENVALRSAQLMNGLQDIVRRNPELPLQEIRGRGLMIGIQFSDNAPSGISGETVAQCLERGLMILNTSKFEILRLIPPLNVTADQCAEALKLFEEGLKAAVAAKGYVHNGPKVASMKPCCATPCYKNLDGTPQACRFICQR